MIYSFDYDVSYDGPAMPVVDVTLVNLMTGAAATIARVLVDSGADGTIVPFSLLKQIQARWVDTRNMRFMHGSLYRVNLYEVELQVGRSDFPALS